MLCSFGPFSLHWLAVLIFISLLTVYVLAHQTVKQGEAALADETLNNLLFYSILGGFIGGRIGYCVFYQFEYMLINPVFFFDVRQGGMSFHGALLGSVGASLIYAIKMKIKLFDCLDLLAPLVPIVIIATHLAHFITGELWGRVTQVPWAVVYAKDELHLPRHPSPLYELALEGILLWLILYFSQRKITARAVISGLFLSGYGILRIFAEFFREPDLHLGYYFSSISMGQILSIPMVIVGITVIYWGYLNQAKESIIGQKK